MIQIDMPMPKNCLDCPACNEYLTCAIPVNGRKWGENDVREFCQGRPERCPLKEQEAVVKQWIKEIADKQLAHAPEDSNEFMSLDEHLENEYKRGIWDGLQIAWNIISEGR